MPTTQWPRRFQKLGFIGLLLLAVNFTYQIYDRYMAKPNGSVQRSPCDLEHKSCVIKLSNRHEISFNINPKPILSDKKQMFSVQLKNITANSVSLTLTPIGEPQYAQNFMMKDAGKGHFSTEARLEDIRSHQSDWLALVRIQENEQYRSFPFKFHKQTDK